MAPAPAPAAAVLLLAVAVAVAVAVAAVSPLGPVAASPSSALVDDRPYEQRPHPPGNAPIRTIHVIGERHTGTNHLRSTLVNCLEPGAVAVIDGFGTDKHLLHPIPELDEPQTLVVATVRNPYDFLLAMSRVCYCCEALQALPFDEFLKAPFTSTRFGFKGCSWADIVFAERHRHFSSVVEARVLKMRNILDLRDSKRLAGVEAVRLEDIWEAALRGGTTAALLRERLAAYDLPWRAGGCAAGSGVRDARSWNSDKEFSAEARVAGSLYLTFLQRMEEDGRRRDGLAAPQSGGAAELPASTPPLLRPLAAEPSSPLLDEPFASIGGMTYEQVAQQLATWRGRARASGAAALPDPQVLHRGARGRASSEMAATAGAAAIAAAAEQQQQQQLAPLASEAATGLDIGLGAAVASLGHVTTVPPPAPAPSHAAAAGQAPLPPLPKVAFSRRLHAIELLSQQIAAGAAPRAERASARAGPAARHGRALEDAAEASLPALGMEALLPSPPHDDGAIQVGRGAAARPAAGAPAAPWWVLATFVNEVMDEEFEQLWGYERLTPLHRVSSD